LLFNCCLPEVISTGLSDLATDGRPFGAYANAFSADLTKYGPGETVEVIKNRTDLDPPAYAAFALQWIATGATIIGGYCQTDPSHIAEITRQVEAAGHTIAGAV
ncbi:MAG: homocysteine S-methyltransferase family protein, partial [Pseudomonadota bacterium]